MKVCVLGLGYIGLPTASLLATKGYDVVGVDVLPSVVEGINRGEIHIYEPDLDVLVRSAVNSGRLRASLIPVEADVFIIAVPTPFKADHVPDLHFVQKASEALVPVVKPGDLIILESTSPVGTTDGIAALLHERRPDLSVPTFSRLPTSSAGKPNSIYIAHCPERVLPGQILRELVENDRVVGGVDEASTHMACEFYRKFVHGAVVPTDSRTAEMAKLSENSFRDVNIAFANELSMICDRLNIDVWELISIANRHPRVKILEPGPGVGGHCIAVDPWFIVHSCPEEARLIRTARIVNDSKPAKVVATIKERALAFKSPTIACLGLAFKADVDDLRESPAIEIVKQLISDNVGNILVVEPHIQEVPVALKKLGSVELCDMAAAINRADIVVLLVSHRQFKSIDRRALDERIVIDTRGMFSKENERRT